MPLVTDCKAICFSWVFAVLPNAAVIACDSTLRHSESAVYMKKLEVGHNLPRVSVKVAVTL